MRWRGGALGAATSICFVVEGVILVEGQRVVVGLVVEVEFVGGEILGF